jgi:hypothetical protein
VTSDANATALQDALSHTIGAMFPLVMIMAIVGVVGSLVMSLVGGHLSISLPEGFSLEEARALASAGWSHPWAPVAAGVAAVALVGAALLAAAS